jgi:hypothetical protein
MASLQRLWMAVKVLGQLGPARTAENGLYRLGLKFNAFNIPSPAEDGQTYPLNLDLLPALPALLTGWEADQAVKLAEEIVGGKARLFGGEAVE